MPRTGTRSGASGAAVRRPPRRTHYPDLSLKINREDEPYRLEAPPAPEPKRDEFTLRIVLEIDGDPHTVSFLDSPTGAVQLLSYGSSSRAAILDGEYLCDCRHYRPDAWCRHILSLIAARIFPEPETWRMAEGDCNGRP